jgi:hypothetical protein
MTFVKSVIYNRPSKVKFPKIDYHYD